LEALHFSQVLLFAGIVSASALSAAGDEPDARPVSSAASTASTASATVASPSQVSFLSALTGSSAESASRSLDGATEWLNSAPLTMAALRGKVVLVDFWTYSCINWRREFPYVRAWHEKYRAQGLVVIGVHSPEFAFEQRADNVRRAVKDLGVNYPVAVDSEHMIWRGFDNAYWPALYFIDAKGQLRSHHFGEGGYAQSERIIQQLLREAGATGVSTDLVSVDAQGAEAAADWTNLESPENYVGYARTRHFASPGGSAPDKRRVYAVPPKLAADHWALAGEWTLGPEAITSNGAGGRIVYRFHARDLHLVMGPAVRGAPVRFRVLVDGKPPGAARGSDVDAQGYGTLDQQRMYQLIRQPGPITERSFEIEFLEPGAQAFSFSFG
jgi:thiol-disulfide isomerase/thioredoxin